MSDAVVTKYLYLSFHYADQRYTINAKDSCHGDLVRIKCKNRSFPTYLELRNLCVVVLKKVGINTNFLASLNVLSFEELSSEKAKCLFPDIDIEGDKVVELVV